MDYLQFVILAIVQGVTEFLPISSSAHLILPSQLLGWEDQGLAFDVAVHVGSLLAVVLYFRKDLIAMAKGWLGALPLVGKGMPNEDSVMAWKVVVATIPAVLVAFVLNDFIEQNLRSDAVIAVTTIGFGLLLGYAQYVDNRRSEFLSLSWRIVLLVGVAQALALIPGTSRSGITITMAVLLGVSKTSAARFSFLLSIPLILAAGLFLTLELVSADVAVDWFALLLSTFVSAGSAWLCIALFLRLLDKIGFMPFVIYRLLLGCTIIILSIG